MASLHLLSRTQLLEKKSILQPAWNIPLGDVANYLVSEINPSVRLVVEEERLRPEKSEVFRLIGDTRKIMSLTSWKPTYDLETGLRDTISWFREPENLSRYKAWLYNI